MFDAVIFDWDGTLADTRFVVVTSFQTVLKGIGCDVEDAFVEILIGIGAKPTVLPCCTFHETYLQTVLEQNTIPACSHHGFE